MIRIIRYGNAIKFDWKVIYTTTCKKCGCEFEFEEDDCERVFREKRISGEIDADIKCPCCGTMLHRNLTELLYRADPILQDPKEEWKQS